MTEQEKYLHARCSYLTARIAVLENAFSQFLSYQAQKLDRYGTPEGEFIHSVKDGSFSEASAIDMEWSETIKQYEELIKDEQTSI